MPKAPALRVGTRVRHVETRQVGVLVSRRETRKRWLYVVRWRGLDHDSGEYGIRALETL